MISGDLFTKYEQAMEKAEEKRFNLFGPIDWEEVRRTQRCPYDGNKLYPMMSKPLLYCKSKSHKSFVIKK